MQHSILWANARYEMVTLLRGWFFRIFAGSTLVLFTTINIIFFSTAVPVPRIFNGLSSSVPYANIMMLNIGQIIIVLMLATEFFKRDKKVNTTEVFYIRSMSNATYLFGKLLGIMIVIVGLDILILLIAAVIHLFFSDIHFNWLTYFLYPLVMIIPTFIFFTGLSYLLMTLINNQAIVILILVGLFASELFYFHDKYFFFFDFLAMNLPLAYSDFVGFSNTTLIVWQRGIYFNLGLIFILMSSLLFIRLPQSRMMKYFSLMSIVVLSFITVLFGYAYLAHYYELKHDREKMRSLNEQFLYEKTVLAYDYRISIDHHADQVYATTVIGILNESDADLQQIYLSLNPDLRVRSVQHQGMECNFGQRYHILSIELPSALGTQARDSVKIEYEGSIHSGVNYLDIDDSKFFGSYSAWLYQIQKKYSFLSSDFVLLPAQSLWYPQPGLPAGEHLIGKDYSNFCSFRLEVKTDPQLTVLTQGEPIIATAGRYVFSGEDLFPGISLIIGPYESKSIVVDSIAYSVYRNKHHDYYQEYFSGIEDTLGAVIRELQQEYSVRLNLEYPYKRLALVEVPAQFYSHPRVWTTVQETVQPQQIWLPENGFFPASADFKRLKRSLDRRMDRSNQTLSDIEQQVNIFKSFVRYTFHGQIPRFMRGGGPPMDYLPDFNLFPNYYSYVNKFRADSLRILDTAVEAYLFNKVKSEGSAFSFIRDEGLTESEKVSRLLNNQSLAQLLDDKNPHELLNQVIKKKGAYLFKTLQNQLGRAELESKMTTSINKYRFHAISFTDFIDEIEPGENGSLNKSLENWLNSSGLPAYLVSDVRMFKIMDVDRVRYQVIFRVQNTEPVDGLFEVKFDYRDPNRRMITDDQQTDAPGEIVALHGGASKEIGFVLDTEPRSIEINYIIAQNIPLVYSKQFDKAEMNARFIAFEGERNIPDFSLENSNEIIIDNESDSFTAINPPYQSLLKRLFHDNDQKTDEYVRYRWWNPPQRWRALKNTTFYGRFIHSAYYIRAGTGSKKAVWTAVLPGDGVYDVYTYMFRKDDLWRGRRGRQINYGDYNYTVYHAAGQDEVTIDTDRSRAGWNYLGTYFFGTDSVKVTLSDRSNGRLVIADAIKWVRN